MEGDAMKGKQKKQRLLRTRLFGGYHKGDVDRYVQRLEEELRSRERELDACREKNEKNQKLIEEAIREIRVLRERGEWLQKRQTHF